MTKAIKLSALYYMSRDDICREWAYHDQVFPE